ncbi:MAG: glutamine-hydrolyzing GMP synthase [Bdellovibrionales bacterium]|nr:glutamine-hydrolyzing GMP synthase [Bdellovibrionales bacterium]
MSVEGGVLVLDFGSQYTQLIARRLRDLNVYSEIHPFDLSLEEIKKRKPAGIVISGGPSSVTEKDSPLRDTKELIEIAPVLGICYGMQLIAQDLGGKVHASGHREYGRKTINWKTPLKDVKESHQVWMSHGDVVDELPKGFEWIAFSDTGAPAAMRGPRVLALQFHPEVTHSEMGMEILDHFISNYTKVDRSWKPKAIVDHLKEGILEKLDSNDHVLCALSGGVDSTVVGTLLTKTLGADRVHCVFVNNGLLRKNEFDEVLGIYKTLGLNVLGVDAEKEFLSALKGVTDPEIKRKTIGRLFIEVFEKTKSQLPPLKWLAQGTLYPDVIESVNLRGSSVTIKSHHNVGGLPEKMNLKLVEPLRELFKDEVREVGEQLGIPKDILWRHPFPGPGLAVRVLGEITKERLDILREVDAVFIAALREFGLYDQIWQAFSVLLPVQSVGVQGDGRTYANCVALRAVVSRDGMTADWFDFPSDFLKTVSNRITNKVKEVNRVVYDITSKPPGTIEWE